MLVKLKRLKTCTFFKAVGLHQILMTVTSVTKAVFNSCNQTFIISCNQKPVSDCPFDSEDFNIDIEAPTFPTEITFS